ncbi:MAG: hypothetical protein ACP5NE_03940 [Candidatus Micrarchaeia archaeon]
MKKERKIDSGSSIGTTFMNPDLVTDIKMAKQPINITTNAGEKLIGVGGKRKKKEK